MDNVNATNKAFIVHTVVDGKVTLRVALSSPHLTYEDMDHLAQLFHDQAKIVKAKK